jgi:hypothetical protein
MRKKKNEWRRTGRRTAALGAMSVCLVVPAVTEALAQSSTASYPTGAPSASAPMQAPGHLASLSNGLVAYYPFNGDANDGSGNANDGTLHGGPTPVPDRLGNPNSAYEFDGIDDYITVPDAPSLNFTEAITVAYWIRLQTSGPYYFPYHIIEKFGSWGCSQRDWDIVWSQHGSPPGDAWATNLQPGTDYFFVLTFDGNSRNIYQDGQLVASQSAVGSLTLTDSDIYIGEYDQGGGYYFDGILDDIRIYDRALSEAEIQALAFESSGQVAFYPFNGNANDGSGNGNHGTPYGGPTSVSDRFGNPNRAYEFDGIDDYITIPDAPSLNFSEAITVAYWIRLQTSGPYYFPYHIIEKFGSWGCSQRDWDIVWSQHGSPPGDAWAMNLQPHTDYFFALTFDGNSRRIYQNGQLVVSQTATGSLTLTNSDIYIGEYDQGGDYYFDGTLDDIRIFDRALLQAEINTLYTDQDCNGNGQPDRLDIAVATSFDCNDNGIPDECDIASGTSQDTNYNFVPDECECYAENYCVISPNSAGPGAVIGYGGSLSIAAADFRLQATGCPPKQFGLFYFGQAQIQIPFGNGMRCVGGKIRRLPVLYTGPTGSVDYLVDFSSPPANQITPFTQWNFQFWFRDAAAGGSCFNTSDGLSGFFCP